MGQKRSVQGHLKRQEAAEAAQAQSAAGWLKQLAADGAAATQRLLQYEGLLGACLSCTALVIRCGSLCSRLGVRRACFNLLCSEAG